MQLRRLMIVLAICIVGLVVAALGMYPFLAKLYKWRPIRHIEFSRALHDGGWNQYNGHIRS